VLLRECDLGEVECGKKRESRISTWEPWRVWKDNIWMDFDMWRDWTAMTALYSLLRAL